MSFPFDLHSAAVSDSHLPCHAHALLRACRSSQGHMNTLVYETKVESRAALRDIIFTAAEHISSHPDNVASATQSLLTRAENCIATGRGHLEQLL